MIEKDATYGLLHRFLYGIKSERLIEIKDEKKGKLIIDGIPVTILREARNPVDIPWRDYNVDLVVDCTGKFKDPTVQADDSKGSIRGHLVKGVKAVINSSAFKIKNKAFQPQAIALLLFTESTIQLSIRRNIKLSQQLHVPQPVLHIWSNPFSKMRKRILSLPPQCRLFMLLQTLRACLTVFRKQAKRILEKIEVF